MLCHPPSVICHPPSDSSCRAIAGLNRESATGMKLLKNRKFAILIAAVAIVFATLLGVRGSLNRLARDVETMFYKGIYLEEDGYTQPGIDSQLLNCAQAALDCATVLEKQPELTGEAGALLSARREFMDAKSIREKQKAYISMQRAFAELTEKAGKVELTQREAEAMTVHTSTFRGAQTAIQNSAYNHKAQTFMDEASIFAHLLRPFLFVRPPQLFS